MLLITTFIVSEFEGCLCIEWVFRVRVKQELRQEDIENVHEVEHGRPSLIDHVETHTPRTKRL